MRDYALWAIPYPLRIIIGLLVHRNQVSMLQAQGTGRFTNEEVFASKTQLWSTLDLLLASSMAKSSRCAPFWVLGGQKPTEADTVLFGFVVSVLVCKAYVLLLPMLSLLEKLTRATRGHESQMIIGRYSHILEYADRIHDKYFPDYEKWPAL